MRTPGCARTPCSCSGSAAGPTGPCPSFGPHVPAGEVQVHVFERGPKHLESLQLDPPSGRPCGEAREDARRLRSPDLDETVFGPHTAVDRRTVARRNDEPDGAPGRPAPADLAGRALGNDLAV